jgi:hypothetical protein
MSQGSPLRRALSSTLVAGALGLVLSGLGVGALADSARGRDGAKSAPTGGAPDPPAVASKTQWVFDVAVKRGALSIERVTRVEAKSPASTARAMGRFAIELYVGRELVDRVRFNVPLMGDARPEGRRFPMKPVVFEQVTTKLKVQMADAPRATWGTLLDRAAGDPAYARKADAGAPAADLPRSFWWPPNKDGTLSSRDSKLAPAPSAQGSASAAPTAAPTSAPTAAPTSAPTAAPAPRPSPSK